MKDGGPAFPVLHTIDGNWVKEPLAEHSGMSLRDWFAGMAMNGMLARGADPTFKDMLRSIAGEERRAEIFVATMATAAYAKADAMLAERTKHQGA